MAISVINAAFTFCEGLFHISNVSDTIRWMDLVAKTRQITSPVITHLSQALQRALPLIEPVSAIDKFCTFGRKVTDYCIASRKSGENTAPLDNKEDYAKFKIVNIVSSFFDAVGKSCSAISVLAGIALRVSIKMIGVFSCIGLICDLGRAATAIVLHLRDLWTDMAKSNGKALFAHTILLIKESSLLVLACFGVVIALSFTVNPLILIGLGVIPLIFEPLTKNLVDKFGSSAA